MGTLSRLHNCMQVSNTCGTVAVLSVFIGSPTMNQSVPSCCCVFVFLLEYHSFHRHIRSHQSILIYLRAVTLCRHHQLSTPCFRYVPMTMSRTVIGACPFYLMFSLFFTRSCKLNKPFETVAERAVCGHEFM